MYANKKLSWKHEVASKIGRRPKWQHKCLKQRRKVWEKRPNSARTVSAFPLL